MGDASPGLAGVGCLAVQRDIPLEFKREEGVTVCTPGKTTLEGPPERIDDATRHVREQVLPQLQQMDGFKGFVALSDRQSGKVLGVAFRESEEVLRATEEAVSRVRSGAAEAGGGTVAGVEQYEVSVFEVSS